MSSLKTTSVSLAITPTAVSTLFSHFLNKNRLKERPTVHLSYDEGLHLAQSFLEYASHHTVEELQGFTSQWVPSPHWIKLEGATVPNEHLTRAAELIQDELGEEGLAQVGGRRWWQWRGPASPPLEGEWIEMRAHANERKRAGEPLRRVMLYVHGGAYYFGSVDEHRYQMQRHARKLRARVFAPRYRLSPQFPFPCGLQDCLAAYLYLVATQDPRTIVLAGDSAGGGMVLALLCLLRDRGVPLPAGGILISPWVDLAHSFPSVGGDAPLDYIPSSGFHHKPSRAWPPPNDGDLAAIRAEVERKRGTEEQHGPEYPNGVGPDTGDALTVAVDGELITLRDQIQMYTTNRLLSHPLVSPVMQPTLGGLPPLLIIVGGGEILRDEQIYVAHKCANPGKYAPAPAAMTDRGRRLLAEHRPTDVQLQVWDDLCHVATTLSFTRPAKYMYRSVAQFGAWALARAQKRGIEIPNDSNISVITTSGSDAEDANAIADEVGKAGDALPAFQDHMIRQRVTRAGRILPLPREEDLAGCCVAAHEVGVIKEGPVRKWIEARRRYDGKYASARAKVHRKVVEETIAGFWDFGAGEVPPPSALAGRIPLDETERRKMKRGRGRRRRRNMGLALWSLWASKHDDLAVAREQKVAHDDATVRQRSRSSRSRTVADEGQAEENNIDDEEEEEEEEVEEEEEQESLVAQLLAMRRQREAAHEDSDEPETGVAGKRPFLDGIALPFSIKNEAATASMATLHSDEADSPSRPASPWSPSSPSTSFQPRQEEHVDIEEGYTHT